MRRETHALKSIRLHLAAVLLGTLVIMMPKTPRDQNEHVSKDRTFDASIGGELDWGYVASLPLERFKLEATGR